MKINLNYRQPEPKEGHKNSTDSELTLEYINYAVSYVYPIVQGPQGLVGGLEGQLRRKYGRIQTLLNDAVDEKKEEVSLTEDQLKFLYDVFEKAQFAAPISRFVIVLEEEISRAYTEAKKPSA